MSVQFSSQSLRLARRVVGVLFVGSALVGCAVSAPAQAPEVSTPPAVVNDDNYVSHVAVRTVQWSRPEFRAWLEREQLVKFFPKDRGLPGFKGSTPMRGQWGTNGAIRRVELDNGHYAFDHILNNRYPDVFQYQVYGFTNEAARIAAYIRAELRYDEVSPGVTRLSWTYSMRPKSGLTQPLVSMFMSRTMKPYMEAALDNMAAAAAAARSSASGTQPLTSEPQTAAAVAAKP
jgi:hypothetical protein